MQQIKIPCGSLVVMSGVPGSGKSHILKKSNLPAGVVQSSDGFRRLLAGESSFFDSDNRLVIEPSPELQSVVWDTIVNVTNARLAKGLTTVIDATLVADEVPGSTGRSLFASIAERHGVPFLVVIVDTPLEQVLANNENREARVPVKRIHEFINGTVLPAEGKNPARTVGAFDRASRYPHVTVDSNAVFTLVPPLVLDGSAWDIIGDVHGLLKDLKGLLIKLGYEPDAQGIYRHPDGRRLLFLGDIVDRGPESLEALEFVRQHCDAGIAKCIAGNHEAKLISFIDVARKGELESWTSFANALTGMEFLKLPEDKQAKLYRFMKGLPLFAFYEDDKTRVIFGHADAKAFQLGVTSQTDLLHGCGNWGQFDSDLAMQRWLQAFDVVQSGPPTKKQYYVRGHVPGTSWQPQVTSLDAKAFQRGSLLALKLDALLQGQQNLVPQSCDFDFDATQKARTKDYKDLEDLVTRKLATVAKQGQYGLRLYKYSKQVFFDHLWGSAAALSRARGHVFDVAGTLVSNPFDKVFNYREEGAGENLASYTPVRGVEKLNGFLGVISPHPVLKGELLVHTTGSFTSDFVGYITDFVTPKVKGALLRAFSKHHLTLMFEVLHPKDPHIIKYTEAQMGLYLIGARSISVGSPLWTEAMLDELADELGLRRPAHFETTFGGLLAMVKSCRGEGYMVRLGDEQETTVLKLKGSYYMTTKFMARMGTGKWKHLFANPEDFKTKVDEEFYPLVDDLTSKFQLEELLELDEQQKLELVRELVS